MAEDADVRSHAIEKGQPFFGQLPPFIQNVADSDPDSGQFDRGLRRKAALVVAFDVAGDHRHRGNRFKLFYDRSLADIAGVNNMIHVMEMAQDRRIEETMGIGDNPDTDWS